MNASPVPGMDYFMIVLGAILLASLALNAILIFRYVWTSPSKKRHYWMNFTLLGFAVFTLLFVLEIGAYYFLVESHGYGSTLSAQRWFTKYWQPVNSYGYRDTEHSQLDGKKILFAVGDSFVAGQGIEDPDDRFPNILDRRLGESWEVISIAKNGWNTINQFAAMASYPAKPDVVLLAYFINDIEGAADKVGLSLPPLSPPHKLIKPIVNRSYFVNYFYWRMYRHLDVDFTARYGEYLSRVYKSEEIWKIHQGELQSIIDYGQRENVRLYVLLIPFLNDIQGSRKYAVRVSDFFREKGVPVVDLTELFKDRDPIDLTVSGFDSHANTAVHREIADTLFHLIFRKELTRKTSSTVHPTRGQTLTSLPSDR